ncbi:hypothetical protein RRG08_045974 [Elysia crispata]|uniref:C-type lectin domain-containing protein n=1 Tax=Elysia crispata TaxID=231223 RepID=A0AAE1E4D9_9GAST|nr:hypothetical protein RRG08_045974 [Elysia crispata]
MKLLQISVSSSIVSIISFLTLAHECIAADCSCSSGLKSVNPFSTSCIKISTSKESWDKARKVCQEDGGELVKISNNTEFNLIIEKVLSRRVLYWIGLKFFYAENSYKWNDVNAMASKGVLVPKKPSPPKKDLCVFIYKDQAITMNLLICTAQHYFICESPPVCESNAFGAIHFGSTKNSCCNRYDRVTTVVLVVIMEIIVNLKFRHAPVQEFNST